jgi:hypothetical protein
VTLGAFVRRRLGLLVMTLLAISLLVSGILRIGIMNGGPWLGLDDADG